MLTAKLPAHGKRAARLCICGGRDTIQRDAADAPEALRLLLGEVARLGCREPESADSEWLELDRLVGIEQLADSWTTWAKGAGGAKLLSAAGHGAPLSKRCQHMKTTRRATTTTTTTTRAETATSGILSSSCLPTLSRKVTIDS